MLTYLFADSSPGHRTMRIRAKMVYHNSYFPPQIAYEIIVMTSMKPQVNSPAKIRAQSAGHFMKKTVRDNSYSEEQNDLTG